MLSYYRLILLIALMLLNNVTLADAHLNTLNQQLDKAAAQYRSQQELCLKSEDKLKSLEWEKTQKTFQLEKQLVRINGYLSALKKIQLISPAAILNSSMTPQRLVQSVIILNAFIRNILQSTQSIRSELQTLNTLKGSIEQGKISAQKLGEQYNEKLKEIESLLRKRRQMVQSEIQSRKALEKRIDHLAHESHSLHDLMQRLESEESRPKQKTVKISPQTAQAPQQGKGRYKVKPVVGPIISSFGQKHEKLDTEGTGLIFQTKANSLVYAPLNATVVYAGPFRKYKKIVILAHHGHYHTLIIGLSQIEVSLGQTVFAGEPIGYTGTESPSYLYVELRAQQKPIDPLPWFGS
jgi:septal ring factor EnvC (AmiA/AmiB activator)